MGARMVWLGEKFNVGELAKGGGGRSRHRLGEPETGLGHLYRVEPVSGCSIALRKPSYPAGALKQRLP